MNLLLKWLKSLKTFYKDMRNVMQQSFDEKLK